mmetsp:Transcript_36689/g.103533  ORF Transcript_36689/g.103533 Transcript_36689/m.103533 type:complete len:222 (+) Transcript_36689:708-1373(+)
MPANPTDRLLPPLMVCIECACTHQSAPGRAPVKRASFVSCTCRRACAPRTNAWILVAARRWRRRRMRSFFLQARCIFLTTCSIASGTCRASSSKPISSPRRAPRARLTRAWRPVLLTSCIPGGASGRVGSLMVPSGAMRDMGVGCTRLVRPAPGRRRGRPPSGIIGGGGGKAGPDATRPLGCRRLGRTAPPGGGGGGGAWGPPVYTCMVPAALAAAAAWAP